MNDEVTIKGDIGWIKLQIHGRENAQARDVDDANWLRATLSVRASSFSGEINLTLWATELETLSKCFESSLVTLTEGFQFESLESNWTINVHFTRTGEVLITGQVKQDTSLNNTLNYEFHSDPISLEAVLRQLRQISTAYPVLTTPDKNS